jgi:hypothetical protein
MGYADIWARALSVTSVLGVLLALAEFEPRTVVAMLGVTFSVAMVAIVAAQRSGPCEPSVDWPKARRGSALVACAALGLPAGFGVMPGSTMFLALVLACSAPPVVAVVRGVARLATRWPHRPDGPTPPRTCGRPSQPDRVAWLLEQGPTPERVASLDTATLCLAWRRSFQMLAAASTVCERAVVAELRQLYLDELDRRHPSSFAHWLATGPPASSGPDGFLPPD